MEAKHQQGTYRILLRPRPGGFGGTPCEASCDESEVTWFFIRSLNNFDGDRAVLAFRKTAGCCPCFANARAWADEVQFWRGSDLAWVGSAEDIIDSPSRSTCTIVFRARGAKLLRGSIKSTVTFPEDEIPAIDYARALIEDGLAQEDLGVRLCILNGGPNPLITPDIIHGEAIGDELRRISRAGVDISVCGRKLIVGTPEIGDVGALPVVSPDLHWVEPPDVTEGGSVAVRRITAFGSDGEKAVWPPEGDEADGAEAGLLDECISDSEGSTENELLAIARAEFERRSYGSNTFLSSRSSSINCDFPIPLSRLCPGTPFRVEIDAARGNYCRSISQVSRLGGVRAVSYTHLTLPTNREV